MKESLCHLTSSTAKSGGKGGHQRSKVKGCLLNGEVSILDTLAMERGSDHRTRDAPLSSGATGTASVCTVI
jgi:hypothetical protein